MRIKRAGLIFLTVASLNLLPVQKASAFDIGGVASGIIGQLGGLGLIDEALANNLTFYTQIGQTLLNVINTKSLDSLVNILPSILGRFTSQDCGGFTGECLSGGGESDLLGKAGAIDWGGLAQSIVETVNSETSDSDSSAPKDGPISSGVTDKRFRPRITTIADNKKTAAWSQLQEAEFEAIFSKEGQEFIDAGRKDVSKMVENSADTTKKIQKLDNTQDILKANSVNDTLSIVLQQRGIEEQLQTRLGVYEGNQTNNKHLSIAQREAWMKEVEESQAHQSAHAEGRAFAEFIGSAYTQESP